MAAATLFQVTALCTAVFCWPFGVAACAAPANAGPERTVTGTLTVSAATAALASQVRRVPSHYSAHSANHLVLTTLAYSILRSRWTQ